MLLLMVGAYVIGSIPTGVIISKKFFGFDIRTQGSKNMGSTNTMRVLGLKWGILVQSIDILKGFASVMLLANLAGNNWNMCAADSFLNLPILQIIMGMTAVAGHIFSCFVKFKGGKGINTALGMLIAILPIELGIALGAFTITVGISGYVSLGSMVGAATLPIVLFLRYNLFNVDIKGYLTLMCFILGFVVLVFVVHRGNIVRLAKRSENKMEKMQFIKKIVKRNKQMA